MHHLRPSLNNYLTHRFILLSDPEITAIAPSLPLGFSPGIAR